MKTVAEALTEARELLDKKGWTQGAYARDANGDEVLYYSKDACKFCARGALFKACGNDALYLLASDALDKFIPNALTVIWNDDPGRTKEDVLAVFTAAIEASK